MRGLALVTHAVVLLLVLGIALLPGRAAPRLERITLLGGPPAGVFGIFATGIATYLARAVPDVNVSVAATGGSVENVRRVNAGDAEMGIAFASDLHEGFAGVDAFRGNPQPNIRAIGVVFTGVSHIVTFQDKGIRTVDDLAGKRVALGTPGSGTFATAERIFRKLGVWERITRIPLLGAAAGDALIDGRADAFFWTGPFPDRVTIEAATARPVHVIDAYTPVAKTDFFTVYPYFSRYLIPGGAYRGTTENVYALGIPSFWFANANVPAPLVQRLVEAAYSRDGLGHMLRVHAAAADMAPRRALQGATIPLHRGAEAHWLAVGLEIPEKIRAR
jgi:hypothetical protein